MIFDNFYFNEFFEHFQRFSLFGNRGFKIQYKIQWVDYAILSSNRVFIRYNGHLRKNKVQCSKVPIPGLENVDYPGLYPGQPWPIPYSESPCRFLCRGRVRFNPIKICFWENSINPGTRLHFIYGNTIM